jgi:FkbM family methyltransferase
MANNKVMIKRIYKLFKKHKIDISIFENNPHIKNKSEIIEQINSNFEIIHYIYKDLDLYINNDKSVLYHIVNSTDKLEKLANSCELSENSCLLDIGANVGLFSKFYLIKNPKCRVYLFEPETSLNKVIAKNLEGYNYEIINKGISDFQGLADFYSNKGSFQTSSLLKDAVIPFETDKGIDVSNIQVTTISDFILDYKIEEELTIKLDIQGSEFNALKQSQDILPKVNELLIEISFAFGGEPIKLLSMLDSYFPNYTAINQVYYGVDLKFFK